MVKSNEYRYNKKLEIAQVESNYQNAQKAWNQE